MTGEGIMIEYERGIIERLSYSLWRTGWDLQLHETHGCTKTSTWTQKHFEKTLVGKKKFSCKSLHSVLIWLLHSVPTFLESGSYTAFPERIWICNNLTSCISRFLSIFPFCWFYSRSLKKGSEVTVKLDFSLFFFSDPFIHQLNYPLNM